MSDLKKLHREYFNEWVDADNKAAVNNSWIAVIGENERTFSESLHLRGYNENCSLIISSESIIKRKPKTQMINGHEVVAPRYDDDPMFEGKYFWYDPTQNRSFSCKEAELITDCERGNLARNGWFEYVDDVEAYAKAHRESK